MEAEAEAPRCASAAQCAGAGAGVGRVNAAEAAAAAAAARPEGRELRRERTDWWASERRRNGGLPRGEPALLDLSFVKEVAFYFISPLNLQHIPLLTAQ